MSYLLGKIIMETRSKIKDIYVWSLVNIALEQNFGLKRPYGYCFIQILLHAKGSYLRNINPPLHPAAPSSILATNIVIIEFLG